MLKQVYSVRDAKGNQFFDPMFALTHGQAERNFKDAVNDPQSGPISKYPEDFTMYHLGTYDTTTGVLEPLKEPQKIADALALKNAVQ